MNLLIGLKLQLTVLHRFLMDDHCSSSEVNQIDEVRRVSSEDEESCFKKGLTDWAIEHNETRASVDHLLNLLRTHKCLEYLPKNSRTLLKSPQHVNITSMGSDGEFWYNGLAINLKKQFCDIREDTQISLKIHVDGVQIYRSSKVDFWPILYMIEEKPEFSPEVVAIYCGDKKPDNCSVFLKQFVDELEELMANGLVVNNHTLSIKIKCVICDSPARAFIKGTVYFNHSHGCGKCEIEGTYYKQERHMSFVRSNARKRTDESFRGRRDEFHHREISEFERLKIDMVRDFPIADSLHLIDLGVMKKMLLTWVVTNKNYNTKFCCRDIQAMSSFLKEVNSTMPSEIHRRARPLSHLKNWKGTEFRTFILYLGPVILRNLLPDDAYFNFMLLFCAVTICSSDYYKNLLNVAEVLFAEFIETYINVYGIDAIGSNLHGLIHLVDDVRHHGSLDKISSYPFESYLHQITQMVRGGHKPLTQAAKRIIEKSRRQNESVPEITYPILKGKISQDHDLPDCSGSFNCVLITHDLFLKNDLKNKWFLTKGNKIVQMINATKLNGEINIYGTEIRKCGDYFEKPIRSSHLNIYSTKFVTGERQSLYRIQDLKCKLFSIHSSNEIIFFPLLHTLTD
uniref:Transposase domain-containing protein n=1 Tax=Phlebotomus papatasi TaxID=29031 RepID=A0A1B0DMI0_PHLPP